MDMARLNFSHGSHDDHKRLIGLVREESAAAGRVVPILQDLQGPKIRIGEMKNGGVLLHKGQSLYLTAEPVEYGTRKRVHVSYPSLASAVEIGGSILVDDGNIELSVMEVNGAEVKTEVVVGGVLRSRKGVNLPQIRSSSPSLTEKDRIDLQFGLENDVDFIGLSFVRSAEDVRELIGKVRESGKSVGVIAKIEKPEALKEIDEIIKEADAIMVARGDLGVEIPMQDVPIIQRELVRKCRKASKPVIIATQMIESMMESITPTRAEVNDVANAVMDGADAVMLSAETSLGNHPVEVIQAIYKIIKKSETFDEIYFHYKSLDPDSDRFISDSICFNAAELAERVEATAIVTMSFSGYTGRKISSYRPKANILVFTANKSILNMLSLIWGVHGFYYDKFESTDRTISDIMQLLKDDKWINKGDFIINITSMPIADKARSNMLKLSKVA